MMALLLGFAIFMSLLSLALLIENSILNAKGENIKDHINTTFTTFVVVSVLWAIFYGMS